MGWNMEIDAGKKFPCRDCVERKVGCHSTCPKYISALEKNEARKNVIKNAKERESLLYGKPR